MRHLQGARSRQTILDFAGETGVSKCNTGYASTVHPVHESKAPLHEFMCTVLRCNLDELAGQLHLKDNYGSVCRAVKRRQLTCRYLDDTCILNFDRFTFNDAEKERLSNGSGTTVAQYLQEKRNLVLEHPGLPCIVTRGHPYKFALECVLV